MKAASRDCSTVGPTSPPGRRAGRTLRQIVPILLLPLAASGVNAQQVPAALHLFLVDAGTSLPMAGVEVVVNGGPRAVRSGADGAVEIAGVAGDSMVLDVRMVGYEPRELVVMPTAGVPLLLTIPLEIAPFLLDPVSVEVAAEPRSRQLRAFYARARRGSGEYLTRAEIVLRKPRNLNDLFRTMPGISLSTSAFGEKPVMEAKGSMLPDRGSSDCEVQYFLDGTPIQPPEGAIGFDVDVREVEGIEIYRRGTGAPAQFQRQHGSCGVILIWKREDLSG